MYETGEMSLKRSISLYGPQFTRAGQAKQDTRKCTDFSEGGVSRSNMTNLQFPFHVPHTGIYIYIYIYIYI